jgi:hypothetical protein
MAQSLIWRRFVQSRIRPRRLLADTATAFVLQNSTQQATSANSQTSKRSAFLYLSSTKALLLPFQPRVLRPSPRTAHTRPSKKLVLSKSRKNKEKATLEGRFCFDHPALLKHSGKSEKHFAECSHNRQGSKASTNTQLTLGAEARDSSAKSTVSLASS